VREEVCTFCGIVDAENEEAAWAKIALCWPGGSRSFCDPKEPGWRPPADRFPWGGIIVDDPLAVAVINTIAEYECKTLLERQRERVAHFARRLVERGDDPALVAIVVLCVDDENGAMIAEILMPGHDWDAIRARGEIPCARGLAQRDFCQLAVDDINAGAGERMRAIAGPVVVVVGYGTADAFPAEAFS
jgi:hypothetical protein